MVAQLPAVASQEEQMPDKQQRVLEYEAAGASDQGRTRKINEDSYGLNLHNEEGGCNFVVCDGMGARPPARSPAAWRSTPCCTPWTRKC